MQSWIFEELTYRQRRDALSRMSIHAIEAKAAYDAEHHGVRAGIAEALVRFGMMLDRVAGQRAATGGAAGGSALSR